jgi:redox-sensitive bicupin YhaK (pirin superfamily)
MQETVIQPGFVRSLPFQHFSADTFPSIHPVHWLHSHFAVGGWSPLQRLNGMLTAHMTAIAPHNGFTWHPHRGLEIFTWVLEGTLHHEDTTGGEGDIGAGELQRMFSGDWIEHQELNVTDQPARVIQIWYMADPKFRGLEPHYQQTGRDQLPVRQVGDAAVYELIGGRSPMQQHMRGRLTATTLEPGGETQIERPKADEDLFLYITDGNGIVSYQHQENILTQYDVILGQPDMQTSVVNATKDSPLHYLSFYLPRFLS